MESEAVKAIEESVAEGLKKLVFSNPPKQAQALKVKIYPVILKGEVCYQVEEYRGAQVFHSNCKESELAAEAVRRFIEGGYRQGEIESVFSRRTILVGKKGTETVKCKKLENATMATPREHNRKKNYLLEEGTPVPFLVDLGVMNEQGMVVKAHYDKFRQINRFLEFIDDVLPALPKNKELRILDFGCGKSYLTFAVYYYLHVVKKLPVRITGLDLKKTVIAHCNELAAKYGYDRLEFLCGDIAEYEGADAVDMVVTLHACDTATDYAIYKALRWNASVVLSVPCCQHEWNRQMECADLESFTKYGIIRERMSALMTDAFRANVLETCGYKTQLLEFIDMEHTPKNLLIRAVKQNKEAGPATPEKLNKALQPVLDYCKTEPTLYRLLTKGE